MFELIFGAFWTLITAIVSGAFLFGGAISDGEMPVIFFICFFGLFWAIGLFMLFKGLKKILANTATSMRGTETYGIILDIHPNGNSVNGRPQLVADVLVVTENDEVNRYTEVIGFDWNKYDVGQYLKVKHYKNDINIIEEMHKSQIPYDKLNMLTNSHPETAGDTSVPVYNWDDYNWNSDNTFQPKQENKSYEEPRDTIIINGVEYERKK